MAGTVLSLKDYIVPDQLGMSIANDFITWDMMKAKAKSDWAEVARYIFQTDTSQTTNSRLPWKNSTTIPKLAQIRDNLSVNYEATLFPKRKWLFWEGNRQEDEKRKKTQAIVNYMAWAIDRKEFKDEITKAILDYIDYGNAFLTVDWVDQRQELKDKVKVGYVGPVPRRISPFDIVMNPTAPSAQDSPKIIRSMTNLGELKKLLSSMTKPEDSEELEILFTYLRDIRMGASTYTSFDHQSNQVFEIAGYDNYKTYLESGHVEVLTFYGDLYDIEKDELLQNHRIMVVDRHKVVYKKPNPSFFGRGPIHHIGWRVRQDNLWAMGPLDNLVGMQYRIDHLENMKADLMDLTTFPVQKIKGYVEDYVYAPLAKIYCGDDGDVEFYTPPTQALQVNMEIDNLERKMEEMAGSPRDAMGVRTPGEKTMYEVQRLENGAGRMFQAKCSRFEGMLELVLNDMLELARRKMSNTTIRIFDDEFKAASFQELTPEDITGSGRIKPVAAKHFAERAELIQNWNSFSMSPTYQDPSVNVHMSGIKIAQMIEETHDLGDWEIVQENIRLTEQADAQKLANVQQEQTMMEGMTPSGLSPEDADLDA